MQNVRNWTSHVLPFFRSRWCFLELKNHRWDRRTETWYGCFQYGCFRIEGPGPWMVPKICFTTWDCSNNLEYIVYGISPLSPHLNWCRILWTHQYFKWKKKTPNPLPFSSGTRYSSRSFWLSTPPLGQLRKSAGQLSRPWWWGFKAFLVGQNSIFSKRISPSTSNWEVYRIPKTNMDTKHGYPFGSSCL